MAVNGNELKVEGKKMEEYFEEMFRDGALSLCSLGQITMAIKGWSLRLMEISVRSSFNESKLNNNVPLCTPRYLIRELYLTVLLGDETHRSWLILWKKKKYHEFLRIFFVLVILILFFLLFSERVKLIHDTDSNLEFDWCFTY